MQIVPSPSISPPFFSAIDLSASSLHHSALIIVPCFSQSHMPLPFQPSRATRLPSLSALIAPPKSNFPCCFNFISYYHFKFTQFARLGLAGATLSLSKLCLHIEAGACLVGKLSVSVDGSTRELFLQLSHQLLHRHALQGGTGVFRH